MRYTLQQRLTVRQLIWLFPVFFILHDMEEVFTMVPWMEQHPALMARLPFAPAVTTTAQVAGAVAFEWLLTFAAAWCATRELRHGRTHWFFMGLTAALFLNVFTHLGQFILAGGYVPGVWTAPTLLLPYLLHLYGRLRTAGLIDGGGLVRALLTGVPVGLSVVLTAHQVGRLFF